MIILKHPKGLEELTPWKSRLESMTVPHLIIAQAIEQPSIKEDGKAEIIGISAIDTFLDQYEKDLKAWNQDRCDMWFFEEEA